jgi:hypothetical protein
MPKRYSVSSVLLYLDLDKYQSFEGFVDTWWDEETGRMLVRVEEFDTPFIYQTSLPRGIGSNDIGLDRGQLGNTKIVSCSWRTIFSIVPTAKMPGSARRLMNRLHGL